MKVFLWILVAGVLVAIVMGKKNVKKVSEEEDDDEEGDDGDKEDAEDEQEAKLPASTGGEDKEFDACCKNLEVSLSCLPYCNYRETLGNITSAFKDDECVRKDSTKFIHCLNKLKDNRHCCRNAGVSDPQCLKLCDGKKKFSFAFGRRYAKCKIYGDAIFQCAKKGE